jgi:hypothetical protein
LRRALAGIGLLLMTCKPDLDTPRAYACKTTDDCVGAGWVCGLEGFCVDPSQPSPRTCQDDSLCAVAQGWRCGLDERCYDRLDAGAIACRRDAGVDGTDGGDCAPGWVCGLEGSCHAANDAQGWQCLSDSDCAAQWRCAATNSCVDSSADELVTPAHDLSGVAQLNPIALSGMDERRFSASSLSLGFTDALIARTIGSTVNVGELHTETEFTFAWRDGGMAVSPGEAIAVSTGGMVGQGSLFAGSPSTGWRVAEISSTGVSAAPQALVAPPQSVDRFVTTSSGYAAAIVDGGTFVLALDGNGLHALAPPPVGAGASDVLAIFDEWTNALRVFVAAGDGIYTYPPERDVVAVDSNWSGVGDSTTTRACSFGPSLTTWGFGGLRYEQGALSYVVTRIRSVGPTQQVSTAVGLIDRTQGAPDGGDCDGRSPVLECVPCEMDEELEDFGTASLLPPTLWTQCRTAFGAHARQLLTAGPPQGDCTRTPAPAGSSFVTDDPNGGLVFTVPPVTDDAFVRAGAGARAWVGPRFTQEHPVFLDRVPQAVVAVPGIGPVLGADQWIGVPLPEAGLAMHLSPWVTTLSGVGGRSNWVVTKDRAVFDVDAGFSLSPRALVLSDTPQLEAPVHSVVAPELDGGVQLVVTSNDALYAAPLSVDGQPVALPRRLVVFAGNPITGLAAAQPTAAGASVYTLVPGGLFRVDATGDTRWRASEIVLPLLDFISVFTEGGRSRIGARDGTVYALPSRVQLVGPLPDGHLALDFAQVCGTVYALTAGDPSGLLEIDRIEPHVGWKPQQLLDSDFVFGEDARLFVAGNLIFAASPNGAVLAAQVDGCPAQ